MADAAPSPTKERLMRAAISIVARDGMAAATTAAIAEAANVAEGTLYRHFESKDDLLIAAYRQMKAAVFLDATANIDPSLPPSERLKRTWKAIYNAYRTDKDAFLFGNRFAESALAEREGYEAAKAIAKLVADLRRAGIAAGEFRNLSPDLLGALFLAPINYLLKGEIKGRRWTEAELDAAADAVLAGWRK